MEVEYQTLDPLRSNFRTTHHYKPYKVFKEPTFEFKVIYMRIITTSSSSSDMLQQSNCSSMTLSFPPRDLHSCLQINGIKVHPNETTSRPLNKHREDAFTSESAFVNTDRIKFKGKSLPFELQIQAAGASSSVSGVLSRRRKEEGDDECMWVMECKEGEFNNGGISVDVYFAGRSLGKPLLLNKVVELRKGLKDLDSTISQADHETNSETSSKDLEANMLIQELEHKNIDVEQLNMLMNEEEEILAEEGELSWFNAGVRLGIGLGVGMSLGVGVGLGLIIRTYISTSGVVRKLIM